MFFIALGCWGGALSRVMVIVCGAGINSNKIYGNDGTFILARVMMMWFVVGHARHDPTPHWSGREELLLSLLRTIVPTLSLNLILTYIGGRGTFLIPQE
jgi:hypothetical protein